MTPPSDVMRPPSKAALLATDGWKTESQGRINGHGGCGSARSRAQDGFDTKSMSIINILRDARQRIPAMR
jgi:hypothetical protein